MRISSDCEGTFVYEAWEYDIRNNVHRPLVNLHVGCLIDSSPAMRANFRIADQEIKNTSHKRKLTKNALAPALK